MPRGGEPAQRQVNVAELGGLLKARRRSRDLSLRQVQGEIDNALTASALSRIENGATPEPRSVPALAAWLGIPVDWIAWPGQSTPTAAGMDTPDVVEVHLRADRRLNPVAADVLAQTFRRLYEDIVAGRIPLAEAPKHKD